MSKAERTKAFIIEKTAAIFNKKGFAGTSLNDMTEATGLTKGSIYGNFSNKDEVALAVFDYNLQKLNACVAAQFSKQKTAKDKLMVYVNKYEEIFNSSCDDGGCPILNTAIEADDTHPQLRNQVAKAVLSWKGKLTQILEQGKADGEFNANINTEQIALTMISMIEGSVMISKLLGSSAYIGTVMQSLKKMINDLK
ncbi:TetR/AcrR family transcriptional regulator [Pedobacter frigiditerrae]|uniref:TetR/AcrR family transcriptional regulator n=1 Tax=Pedobacter frigiditerrae TaxID=2530452 RepID=UPI00292DA699|nr:TetR/AcrR family transcriptional regulator [Pedobacter frigiditerrae]